ncbi:MAG: hypothetical protein IPL61_27220 [Myxococcales bacterium]|nr:hypothetical protein [Myxococcales bacterium]
MFVPQFTATGDGAIDLNGAVELRELRELDPTAQHELRDDLSDSNLAILDAALGLAGDVAFLQRRVDAGTGEARGFALGAAPPIDERHVHPLPAHQALIVGPTVAWFDGAALHDVTALPALVGYYHSAVTADGHAIAVLTIEP